MADAENRTEQPTSRRREEARKKGQVAYSREASSVATMIAALLVMLWEAPAIAERSGFALKHFLGLVSAPPLTIDGVGPLLRDAALVTGRIIAPFLVITGVMGLAAAVGQVGWLVAPEALVPKLERLNLSNGAKRMFSANGAVEVLKAILKISLVGYVAYRVVSGILPELVGVSTAGPAAVLDVAGRAFGRTWLWVTLVLAVLAAFDVYWQRHQHEQSLKMTRQEVKDERRQSEGDPKIKGQFRRAHMELSRRRMLVDVKAADLVLTNPVHVAVALRYAAAEMRAPRLVAKGAGDLAERIKDVARRAGVPIIERRALARALFRAVRVGQEIPPGLYRAVAEVLAYVYAVRGARAEA